MEEGGGLALLSLSACAQLVARIQEKWERWEGKDQEGKGTEMLRSGREIWAGGIEMTALEDNVIISSCSGDFC